MATTQGYVEFVCGQIDDNWEVRYRKMFGEYMVYVNDKPLLLVCDNTVFVKQLECIRQLSSGLGTGPPYKGAKEHYVLDIDDRERLNAIIQELEQVIPVPVRRKPKKKNA